MFKNKFYLKNCKNKVDTEITQKYAEFLDSLNIDIDYDFVSCVNDEKDSVLLMVKHKGEEYGLTFEQDVSDYKYLKFTEKRIKELLLVS